MTFIVSLFHVLAAITLILVVLLQAGKDSGLSGAFGSGGGNASDSVFGAQSNQFLNKFTSVMAIVFMITSLILALISSHKHRSIVMKEKDPLADVVPAVEKAAPAPVAAAAPAETKTAVPAVPAAEPATETPAPQAA